MSKYDEYGFDKNWMHKDTGTGWDTQGFNRNGTIHKDTPSSKDKFGHRRGYYSGGKVCAYSVIFLNRLFLDTALLNFNGEEFMDEEFTGVKLNYKNVSKIVLDSFYSGQTTNYTDTRPRKLNGEPDHRYKSEGKISYTHSITYTIVYYLKKFNKKVSFNFTPNKSLSKNNIEKTIERYNLFLFSIENPEFSNLYEEFLRIKEGCVVKAKEIDKFKQDKKKKIDIYNKLNSYKEKFTDEQQKQFEHLEQELKVIDSNAEQQIIDLKKDFDDIYKKLKAELEVEKNYQKQIEEKINSSKANDHINNLFAQIK